MEDMSCCAECLSQGGSSNPGLLDLLLVASGPEAQARSQALSHGGEPVLYIYLFSPVV